MLSLWWICDKHCTYGDTYTCTVVVVSIHLTTDVCYLSPLSPCDVISFRLSISNDSKPEIPMTECLRTTEQNVSNHIVSNPWKFQPWILISILRRLLLSWAAAMIISSTHLRSFLSSWWPATVGQWQAVVVMRVESVARKLLGYWKHHWENVSSIANNVEWYIIRSAGYCWSL